MTLMHQVTDKMEVKHLPKKKTKETEEPLVLPQYYTLIAADLSLKRPGFCVLNVEQKEDGAFIEEMILWSVDNKTKTKPRGQLLKEIASTFATLLASAKHPIFLVREQCINNCGGKFGASSTAARTGISAVVGVMDLMSWSHGELVWHEYYPLTIKKLLTGNGKADKTEVANSVMQYFKGATFKNDDESDAAAVAIAWLIKNGQIKQITQEDTPSERTEESNCPSDGRSVGECAAQAA